MQFEFNWDSVKAASNLEKHHVSFEEAMSVFLDPLALSRLDEDSSFDEERWVTMGQSSNTKLVLVIRTYIEVDRDLVAIRVISARRPTKREVRQYQEGTA